MAEYAFCEPPWATVRSWEHIREVPGDRLKVGGGIDGIALCGFDLAGGWDIPTGVDERRVVRGLGAECNPTCPRCARWWAELTDSEAVLAATHPTSPSAQCRGEGRGGAVSEGEG